MIFINKRNTIQKSLVLQAVFDLAHHATADEIYFSVLEKYPQISRATVYRNLHTLAQEGQIRKITLDGEPERFDHNNCSHAHFKCVGCNKIFDFGDFTNLTVSRENPNFKIHGYELAFCGLCPECNKI